MLTTELFKFIYNRVRFKSQGSQWSAVVCYFPFERRNNGFIHKKRGYTSVARASDELYVVSETESAVRQMFVTDPDIRYDNLARRLKNVPYQSEYIDPIILSQMLNGQ